MQIIAGINVIPVRDRLCGISLVTTLLFMTRLDPARRGMRRGGKLIDTRESVSKRDARAVGSRWCSHARSGTRSEKTAKAETP